MGDDDEEEGEEDEEAEEKAPSMSDYIMHFLTLPWKLIFALIPPTGIANGYPTFVISIAFVGLCTAVIGDVAGHLGCFINLKDCVNAIAFVALGTSVPDTFPSKTSGIEDDTADNSVGNVTGSNAVNVFLARRHPAVGGELGGPKLFKTISSGLFVFFWVFYVMISAMEAYGVIEPGF